MTILDSLRAMHPRGAFELTCEPFDDLPLYERLLTAAPTTGRCPVLLADHALSALQENWNPVPAVEDVDRRDPAAALAERYPSGCMYHPDCLAPFGGTFPGLAPASAGATLLSPGAAAASAAGEADLLGEHLLAVVPVSRPADVPAALGWFGTARSWQPWDVAALSAVLRSWEDRFGAVLVKLGRATLDLAVAAPPWEQSECLAAAAEHYAFCDDTYTGNPGTLRDYANLLRGCTRWSFWWD